MQRPPGFTPQYSPPHNPEPALTISSSHNLGLAQALWGKRLVSILLTQQLSSPLNSDEEKGQLS